MSATPERNAAVDTDEAGLATSFEAAVRRVFSSYTVDMTQPEAATAGGPHTLQRIRLVTNHRTPLFLGWANPAQRRAQLHTLGHTLALSKLRMGREIVMPPLEYARFLEAATAVLEDEGMTVEVVAFTKETIDSGVRPRVNVPNRSMTLPYYVVDAMAAVSSLASRMAASAVSAAAPAASPPVALPVRTPASTVGATDGRHMSATGWSTVLRWAPSAGLTTSAGVGGKRSPAR
jgi:hypothetical protein